MLTNGLRIVEIKSSIALLSHFIAFKCAVKFITKKHFMYNLIRTRPTVNSVNQRKFVTKTFSLAQINKRFFYLSLMALIALFAFNDAKSQTTYTWNFTTASATSGSNSNLTVDTFKQVNNSGTTVPRTNASVSSGYSGASGTFNIGAAIKGGGFSASTTTYFELTITPASGYNAQITGLTFGRRCTSTGAQRYTVKTSKDNYVDSLASDTISANSGWALESPAVKSVTSATGTALTLRIYLYNGTGATSTANTRLDDISLTVNVSLAEAAPTAPTSGGNLSACTGGTIPSLSTSAPSGAVVDWYDAASGGTLLQSNSTTYSTGATTAGIYTYYAESRNSPGSLVSATRTPVTLTINQTVAPTITASVDDNSPALGQTVNFSSSITNGGAVPSYQWYKNNSVISGANASTYSTSSFASLDSFYVELTSNAVCVSPTTVKSNSILLTVDNSACSGTPPTTTATATSTNICSGGSSNLSLLNLGAASGYTFQWQTATTQFGTYSNTSSVDTNSTYSATNITTALWYRCVVTCINSGLSSNSNPVQINVTANVTPNVTIATANSSSCAGSSVSYLATPINGGTSPSYAWYLNGSLVNGVTGNTYTSSSFANGDQIYSVLTSNYVCLTKTKDTSATATQNVTANVAASVSIASSANPSCSGASVTFTANPTSGGTPSYQWYNGANPIVGETNATYVSNSIASGSSITVRMVSSITCVTGSPATSNAVVQTVTANVTPSVTITSSNPIICNSGNTTFTGSSRNGGTPTYNWYLNGNLVKTSSTDSSYILSSVSNNDSVYATITSSISCVTTGIVASNGIKETVTTPSTPTVSISSNPAAVSGGVSIHSGSNVTFTATPTFGGTTPTYQWRLGGNNITGATSATYSSTNLTNGNSISCVMTSNYACLATATATSNDIAVTILSNSPFTPGNLLVYRVGDGAGNLVNTGNPVYLDEFTQSGTFVQSKRLTSTVSTDSSIYAGGTGTTEGMMTLSVDGRYVAAPGYYTYTRTDSAITSSRVPRVAATIDINQNVNLAFRLKFNDWSGSGTARSAITLDGTKFYVTGSAGGVRYAQIPTTTGVSTQISGSSITNLRNIGIFNGQLYVSASTGTTRLATVGSGLPTTTGNAPVNLPGFPTTGSQYGFFFASPSIVYITDDGTKLVTKYVLNSGSWSASGTVSTDSACRGMTGFVNGGTVTLFLTSGSSSASGGGEHIYKITDALGAGTLSATATKVVNNGNTADRMAYRGICFAPTSITSQPANSSVCTGSTTSFSVSVASGTNAVYTYKWQSLVVGGSVWTDINNGTLYSGATTNTLSILPTDTTGLTGNQYRCVVTYMGNATLVSNAATLTVVKSLTPSVVISTASTTICSGNNTNFTAIATNGGSSPVFQWYRNGADAGQGSSITPAAGSLSSNDVISCTLNTKYYYCQTDSIAQSNMIFLTVKPSPVIGVSTGGTICKIGSTLVVYNSNTSGGGVWTSSNPSVATIATSNGSSGLVTALSSGIVTITYTKTPTDTSNHCISTASATIKVSPIAAPTAISVVSNRSTICATTSISGAGGTTNDTLISAPTGGVWTSPSTSIATVNAATGIVTGKTAGVAVIYYTITNADGCSASANYSVTVSPIPATPTLQYAVNNMPHQLGAGGAYCVGDTFKVVGSPANGIWTSSNTLAATIGASTGFVSIVGAATTNIKYTYTNAAGCFNSRSMTGAATVICPAHRGGPVSNASSIKNEMNFAIYPNPAKSYVSLRVDKLIGSGSIVITDLYGKQVKVQALSMGNNAIDVSSFSKGFYFVSILTAEGKTTKKLVVE